MDSNDTEMVANLIEPTPSVHLSLDTTFTKSVILESITPSTDSNMIDIKLKINTTRPITTTCNYNPLYDTPSTLSLQLINDLNLASSYLSSIEAIISESLNLNAYKTENENKYTKIKENSETLVNIFTTNPIEDEKEFMDILNDNNIIYEDTLNIYSFHQHCYIQIGCLLSSKYIYIVDAKQLNLWKQFSKRINISNINTIIDDKIIMEIINNMDIKCNDTNEINKIKQSLIGKTIKEIKQQILIENDINSLEMLFNIDNDNIIPCVKGIKLEGFYDESIILKDKRNNILELILNEITTWNIHKQINNDLIILFNKYITNKTVYDMNNKLKEEEYESKINDIIPIYDENRNDINMNTKHGITKIDLNKYNEIQLIEYGFVITGDNNNDILCCILNENVKFEWISYIDSIIHKLSHKNIEQEKKKNVSFKLKQVYNKYVQSFKHQDDEKHKNEYILKFGFGITLNYWNKNEINYVLPKYDTLKNELCANNVCKISENRYYNVYFSALDKLKQFKYKNNNKIQITVNHMICMILFGDLNDIKRGKFNSNCRRKNMDEKLQDLIIRNSEIAHFCKYLNECKMIFDDMNKKKAVYIGISSYLLFDSLSINVQCPIIATMDSIITQKLKNNSNGIILSLKPSYNNTKCINYLNNSERIIYSEYMNISNIFINGLSNKLYISAIQLFENIINGYFIISQNQTTEKTLYKLINNYLSNSNDIKIPKYIRKLFANIINSNKLKYIWLNKNQLQLIKNDKLKQIFYDFENDKIGSFYLFKYKPIYFIKEFQWKINNFLANENYKSNDYLYINPNITFYFQLYPNFLDINKSKKCLLKLYIKTMAIHILAIKIQIDIIYEYDNIQKHMLLKPKWIENSNEIILCETNEFKNINELNLIFGVKILDITQTKIKLNIKKQEINNNDIDIDILTQKIRNEILCDIKHKMEKQIENKYKQEINELNQRINILQIQSDESSISPKIHPVMTKSHSYSRSASKLRRKKTFTLMDST